MSDDVEHDKPCCFNMLKSLHFVLCSQLVENSKLPKDKSPEDPNEKTPSMTSELTPLTNVSNDAGNLMPPPPPPPSAAQTLLLQAPTVPSTATTTPSTSLLQTTPSTINTINSLPTPSTPSVPIATVSMPTENSLTSSFSGDRSASPRSSSLNTNSKTSSSSIDSMDHGPESPIEVMSDNEADNGVST